MDLNNLKAEQYSALQWAEAVQKFWSGFVAEIRSIDKYVGDSTGIQLRWRLPKNDSQDLGLQGVQWEYPAKGTRFYPAAYVGMFKVHVIRLPRELELQVISFTVVPDSAGKLALKVSTGGKDYFSSLDKLALPLRMQSESPRFDSLFFWSSPSDNDKIAERLRAWLAGETYNSEFELIARKAPTQEVASMPPPSASGCSLVLLEMTIILLTLLMS